MFNLVRSVWSPPPICDCCGQSMRWRDELAQPQLTVEDARFWNIDREPLVQLGLPAKGALFVARALGRAALRILLD